MALFYIDQRIRKEAFDLSCNAASIQESDGVFPSLPAISVTVTFCGTMRPTTGEIV